MTPSEGAKLKVGDTIVVIAKKDEPDFNVLSIPNLKVGDIGTIKEILRHSNFNTIVMLVEWNNLDVTKTYFHYTYDRIELHQVKATAPAPTTTPIKRYYTTVNNRDIWDLANEQAKNRQNKE